MKRSLTPWILVITGILFNIASAVITHYFIGVNNQQLNELEKHINQHQTLIDSAWRNKVEIDRKQEFLLLLLTQNGISHKDKTVSGGNPDIQNYIQQQIQNTVRQQRLEEQVNKESNVSDFDAINRVSELAKNRIIETINQTWLEKLDVEERQLPLRDKNAFLLTLAIFLQVTGLILVLARDIRP